MVRLNLNRRSAQHRDEAGKGSRGEAQSGIRKGKDVRTEGGRERREVRLTKRKGLRLRTERGSAH